jgi:tRNA 2-thiouridine synthesizing protein A
MEGITITHESDARGSFCPGPLMELIRQVKMAHVGDVIAVLSADEGSKKDLPAWIAKAKQEYFGAESVNGATRFVCRKIK